MKNIFKKKEKEVPKEMLKIEEPKQVTQPVTQPQEPQPKEEEQEFTLETVAIGLETILLEIHKDIKQDIAILAQNQLLWNTNLLNIKNEIGSLTNELKNLKKEQKKK